MKIAARKHKACGPFFFVMADRSDFAGEIGVWRKKIIFYRPKGGVKLLY